jgi:hypothetical protein
MTTATAKLNGSRPLCEVEGCGARVHGHGLCRSHYDQERYLATTGRSAEQAEAARTEEYIEAELTYGCVAERQSPHGTNSMFKSEEEVRQAWQERREAILEHYLARPIAPGQRPSALVGVRSWSRAAPRALSA